MSHGWLTLDEIAEIIIEKAEGYGWIVRDLNDNSNQMIVKGQNWVAERTDTTTIRAWSQRELAAHLARWLMLEAEGGA